MCCTVFCSLRDIQKEQVAVMCEFLQHLTRKIEHSVGSHGCVLWYDSVTKDGELAWQNALNDKNRYESLPMVLAGPK